MTQAQIRYLTTKRWREQIMWCECQNSTVNQAKFTPNGFQLPIPFVGQNIEGNTEKKKDVERSPFFDIKMHDWLHNDTRRLQRNKWLTHHSSWKWSIHQLLFLSINLSKLYIKLQTYLSQLYAFLIFSPHHHYLLNLFSSYTTLFANNFFLPKPGFINFIPKPVCAPCSNHQF